MKKILVKSLPILFLVLALTFMSIFKHEDTLSDTEKFEFANLSASDQTIDRRAQLDNSVANESSAVEINQVDSAESSRYFIDSNEEQVTVYDKNNNQQVVFQTSLADWNENRDFYYSKYNLN